ncbi:dihydrodipicolinate synthase family protein [Brachybacterium vulturis]|uniref:dihydrodipicolinate synthase family protein n=1 Tax=Brachybacterium vulturis TaxID=2017484 RepID=UPI003736C187
MTHSSMRGVFAVSTTPFTPDGAQDLAMYARSIERVLAAGVDGVLALGATGEALALTDSEREAQIRHLITTVDGRVPVVVGCMAYRPHEVSALITQAAELGASAAMVTPPFYGGLAAADAVAALSPVLATSELPVMVYNNPHSTGVDLLPADLVPLLEHEAFWSVKETSGEATRIRELRGALGDGVEVFVGADGLALEGFTQGANGWVAASSWLTPARCVELWRQAREGDWSAAVQSWDRLAGPLGQIEADPAFISLIKRALGELGLAQGAVRTPLPTASDDAVTTLVATLQEMGEEH